MRTNIMFEKFQRVMLMVFGLLCLAGSFQLFVDPEVLRPVDYAILHEYLPLSARVWLWAILGMVGIAACLANKTELGYAAVILMPAERVISYAYSTAAFVVPGGHHGRWQSASWGLWWLMLFASIFLTATWPEIHNKCKSARSSPNEPSSRIPEVSTPIDDRALGGLDDGPVEMEK